MFLFFVAYDAVNESTFFGVSGSRGELLGVAASVSSITVGSAILSVSNSGMIGFEAPDIVCLFASMFRSMSDTLNESEVGDEGSATLFQFLE